MKKLKISNVKFKKDSELRELKAKSNNFELGYIDDANNFLKVNIEGFGTIGSASLSEMSRELNDEIRQKRLEIKKLEQVKKDLKKVSQSKEFKAVKAENKK